MTTARCYKCVQRNLASIKNLAQNEIFCLQVVAVKKLLSRQTLSVNKLSLKCEQ